MAGNSELGSSSGAYSKEQASTELTLVDESNIDTVPSADAGNIAVFDATGNVVDLGIAVSAVGNVGTKKVSEANIADGYILAYNSTSGELEYIVPPVGGGGAVWGAITGNILDQTDLQNQFATTDGNLSTHIGDNLNPHAVTKAQVGLGNVDNTADLDKPVSNATQSALNAKEDSLGNPAGESYVLVSSSTGVRTWLDPNNLGVTSVNGKTGAVVLNTDDIAEGVTNLYYTDTRADSRIQAAIQDTVSSPTSLYSSAKVDALLSGALNYKGSWDASTNTPTISDATGSNGDFYKCDVAGTQDLGSGSVSFQVGDDVIHNGSVYERFGSANTVDSVNGKVGVVVINATDVGLGNVDNTSDLNKPISTATQTALDGKSPTSHTHAGVYEPANANIQGHINNLANPHAVTKAQVGLGSVDDTADVDKPISDATQIALNAKADQSSLNATNINVLDNTSAINSHVLDNNNPHGVTKAQLGLSNVDNTTDLNKPISTATQTALDAKEEGLGNPTTDGYVLVSTTAGIRSWVAVTNDAALWGNIGGLLANQTDLQNALNAKSDTTHNHDGTYEPANANIQTHIADINNPHGLTATQLGLGNVDDTADIDKPVSDATQVVLDDKVEWKGEWTSAEYLRNQMVRDGDWTMIALTTTTERAAPTPSGDPVFGLPDVVLWTTGQDVASVASGHTYTFTEAGWVKSLRVWVPSVGSDITYRLTIVDLTDPVNPRTNEIILPPLVAGQWNTVALGNEPVPIGSVMKVALHSLNSSSSSQLVGGWTYAGNGNNITPTAGEWSLNQNRSVLNVHKTDLDTVDRGTELLGVTVDSEVQFVQTLDADKSETYLITGASVDNGTYVTYPCSRINIGIGGSPDVSAATSATFDIPVASSTQYEEEVGTWATDPSWSTVVGFLEYGGVAQVGKEDNAYGVDVEFQAAYISPDWELVSTSGSGSSGAGGGSSVEVVNNLTSTDATAALSANMGRELNVTKADLAGSNTQVFKAANGVIGNDVVNFQQVSSFLGGKENYLGTPASDNMVLVSTTGDVRSWALLPVNTDVSAVWGNITGLLGNQTDLQNALNAKSDTTHNHDGTYEPANANIQTHIADTNNPHGLNKSQIGLGNVDNTSDNDKPISVPQQTEFNNKENVLGNPTINGQVLASTVAGARSWVTIDNTDVAALWGNITGTLSNQSDLQAALDLKFNNTGGVVTGDIDVISGTGAKLNIQTTVVGGQPQLHLTDSNAVPRGILGVDTTTGEAGITRISPAGVEETTIRLDGLGNIKSLAGPTGTLPVPSDPFHLVNKSYADALADTLEPDLGLPASNNYVLSSDTLGNRTWVDPTAVGVTSINGNTGVVVLGTDDITEGATNLYYTNTRADNRIQSAIQDTTVSATTLYSSSKIESLLSGALSYKGSWDASTNTPTISDATGSNGDFYKCDVAGTQDLGSGSISFQTGDDVIHNGTVYERFGSTNTVDSVNGQTGVVVLSTDHISEGATNLYFTNARVDARLSGVIDDLSIVTDYTWSSTKIDNAIQAAQDAIIFPVTQVNGKTGNVTVTKADVQLGNVDNTSDTDKPVSTPQQVALDGKSDTNHNHTGTYEPANSNIQNHISATDNPHSTTLSALTDTPSSLVGQGGARVTVKEDESGFEYLKPSAVLSEAKPTGLVDGGELNIVNTTDVQVIAGRGIKIDSFTNPSDTPTVVQLSWNTLVVAIDDPTPTAGDLVHLLLVDSGLAGPIPDTNGVTLHQYTNVSPSPAIVRDEIYLGYVVYNGDTWGEVSSPVVVNNSAISLAEYIKTVSGPSFVQSGGAAYESSTFSLSREAGIVWELNRNWHINKKDPHRESFNEDLNFTWKYINRDFSTVSAATSVVDPTLYDNAGTVQAIGGGASRATIQRVYIDPRDNYWVMYGQSVYDNYEEALARIGVDEANTIKPSIIDRSIFLGYIVSERTDSAWAPDSARFVSAVEAVGGGSGSAPIDTLIDLVDTPSTYTGNANKTLQVNAGETGVEFVTAELGIGEYLSTNIIHDSSGTSGSSITTATENNIYGVNAGQYITTGSGNIAIGTRAARGNGTDTVTGDHNLCVGWEAGRDLTSGTDNILMGRGAGSTFTNDSNKLVISNALSTLISGDFATNDLKLNAVVEVDAVVFDALGDKGNVTGSVNLNIADGQYQKITLTGNTTATISAPAGPCTFYIHIHQDATGNRVLTLPAGKWVNGIAKPNTLTANGHDLLMVHFYGGTNYVYEMMLNLG